MFNVIYIILYIDTLCHRRLIVLGASCIKEQILWIIAFRCLLLAFCHILNVNLIFDEHAFKLLTYSMYTNFFVQNNQISISLVKMIFLIWIDCIYGINLWCIEREKEKERESERKREREREKKREKAGVHANSIIGEEFNILKKNRQKCVTRKTNLKFTYLSFSRIVKNH